MPVTTLDPMSALIVIDLQRGIVAVPTVHPVEGVIANARRLADAFRSRHLPVVLVNVSGGAPGRTEQALGAGLARPEGWDELIEELGARDDDILVTKYTWGAFTGTGLDEILRERGVTQVVVSGVATSAGVESTARQAHELGYNVTIATDAVTDRNIDLHSNSVERIFPRIAETGTTTEILDLVGGIVP
jgi:nicotinamidase-related amidase